MTALTVRPPIPYYGGKQRIAEQIVAHFPPHLHYVEPFAGGLSVLLAKAPSKLETVNDLDRSLVTFWRVLRDRPEEMARVCALTPHSRVELADCRESLEDVDELEVARRVWSQLAQGRAGRRTRTGWRFYCDGASTGAGISTYLRGYVDRMPAAAARLASVQLECMPAAEVIALYGRAPDTLLYVDPPYLGTTRSKQYIHELHSDAEHAELLEQLQQVQARVVLSGYPSKLYQQMLPDWERVEIAASTTQRQGAVSERTEVLWMNFAAQDDLFSQAVTS